MGFFYFQVAEDGSIAKHGSSRLTDTRWAVLSIPKDVADQLLRFGIWVNTQSVVNFLQGDPPKIANGKQGRVVHFDGFTAKSVSIFLRNKRPLTDSR